MLSIGGLSIGFLLVILVVIVYYFLYIFLLKKMNKKTLFALGLIFGGFLIIYSLILGIIGESIMYCSLLPGALASFEPIFLRDVIDFMIGVTPLIGICIGVSIFTTNKLFSIITIIISLISTIFSSILQACVQY